MNNKKINQIIFNVIICIVAAIAIIPFVWSLYASFNSSMVMDKDFFSPFNFSLKNYTYILSEFPYGRWFLNSIIVSVFVCLGNLLINTMAGYALARLKFKGSNFILWMTISLMMIPSQVLLAPTYLVLTKLNWIATYQGIYLSYLVMIKFPIFLLF